MSCNKRAPYLSAEVLRVGEGLTRERGQSRIQTQMVGPLTFQYGNGDREMTGISGSLRAGERQVLRGTAAPSGELRSCAPFQYGQTASVGQFTADRSRHKYEWAIQSKPLTYGPPLQQAVESRALWGGEWTRDGGDFNDC
jgi:hypothetical protein